VIIIITDDVDNIKSIAFNRLLEKIPTPYRIIFAKDDIDTTYHRILGAVCGDEVDDSIDKEL